MTVWSKKCLQDFTTTCKGTWQPNKKERGKNMNKETKYDTKSAREILLQYAGEAYCALGGV